MQRLQRLRPQRHRPLQVFDGAVVEPFRELDLGEIARQFAVGHLAFLDELLRGLEEGDQFIDGEALAHRDKADREDGSQEAETHMSYFRMGGANCGAATVATAPVVHFSHAVHLTTGSP